MKPDAKIEPIILFLFFGIVFFSGVILVCEHFYPMDGQLFQVFATILGNFSGALFMRVKGGKDDAEPTKTTTKVNKDAGTFVQETQVGQTVIPSSVTPPPAKES